MDDSHDSDIQDTVPQVRSIRSQRRLTAVTSADADTLDGLTSTNRLVYQEFRGVGQPTEDFGQAGDVYFDLTPESYAVYARYNKLWIRWESVDRDLPFEDRGYLSHPFLTDKYLWIHHGGAVWLTRPSIRKETNKIQDREQSKAASTFVSELLEYERLHSKVSGGKKRTLLVDDDAGGGNASKKAKLVDFSDSQSGSPFESDRESPPPTVSV